MPRVGASCALLAVLAAAAVLFGAVLPASGATPWAAPTPNAQVDYQLGGAYAPPAGTTVVSRDRLDAPAAGMYTICYVNAFQTQDAELASVWRRHKDLLLRKPGVRVPLAADPSVAADARRYWVSDAGWNEIVLDVSTVAKRTALAEIVGGWIDRCATDGFQAVEPDNLDSWSRNRDSRKRLTEQDAAAFATLLAARAHAAGLAIAQKNTPALSGSRAEIGFDFVVAEECARYDECDAYTGAYADHVIDIEYRKRDFDRACADPTVGPVLSVVRRDRLVSPRGSAGYVFEAC